MIIRWIYPDMERWLFFIRLKIDYFETISKFIKDAIKEEIHTCPIQETNGLDDFSMKGRLIMTYTYKGKYFHIDTNSQLFLVFYSFPLYPAG